MTTNGATDPNASDLPIVYMGYTMAGFKRNIKLPRHMSHLYGRIYEEGMEMADGDSGMRMLMVPRHKRPGDPSHISAEDLDALAERPRQAHASTRSKQNPKA